MKTLTRNDKILIAILVIITLAICVLGCIIIAVAYQQFKGPGEGAATAAPNPGAEAWDRIQKSGKLVVGTSADYAPFEYYNNQYQIDGFDPAVIKQVGATMGLQVEIQDIAFDGLPTALNVGQVDVIIAAMSATPGRVTQMDFTNPYYVGEDAVLAAANSNIPPIKSYNDLAAYVVGAQKGSVFAQWILDNLVTPGKMPPGNFIQYQNTDQGVNDLKSSKLQLIVLDLAPANNYVQAGGVKINAQGLNPQIYVIGLPKGSTELGKQVNQALALLQSRGVLAGLANQYLGSKPQPPSATSTPLPTLAPVPTPTQAPQPTQVVCSDSMVYIMDLSYDDNNMKNPPILQPGQPFTKGWRVRNNGTCTWNSNYWVDFVQGSQMGGQPVRINGMVPPSATYDIYINLIAPTGPGVYQGVWQMRSPNGVAFGERLWVGIQVLAPTAKPTQAPPPPVISDFYADRGQIQSGQCVNLYWVFQGQNISQTQLQRNNNTIANNLQSPGSKQDCPPGSGQIEYKLMINSTTGQTAVRSLFVNVIPPQPPTAEPTKIPPQPPVINFFYAKPEQINLGDCVTLNWSFGGQNLAASSIIRNGEPIKNDPPTQGTMQDCPSTPGQAEYRLVVSAEFGGSTSASQYVVVIPPLLPTEPLAPVNPIATLPVQPVQPIEPVPQPQPQPLAGPTAAP